MSTFLQISQGVCRECGIAGGDTVPSAVLSQTGELQRVVSWVIQAWREIQNRHNDWRWMRAGFTVDTASGDDSYAYGDCTDIITSAAITRFGRWLLNDPSDPPKRYLTASGVGVEGWLSYVDWNGFKSLYRIGTQTNSAPAWIAIDPQNNLVFGPKPDDIYTVSGDYQRSAQVLAADGDTPEMPEQFHDLIMYRAMEKYALYESANEVLIRAQHEANRMMRQLEANQLPAMFWPGPMA